MVEMHAGILPNCTEKAKETLQANQTSPRSKWKGTLKMPGEHERTTIRSAKRADQDAEKTSHRLGEGICKGHI